MMRQVFSRRASLLVPFWCTFLSIIALQTNGSWVDPDTEKEYYSSTALSVNDDRKYELVFSDEFEQDGRTFHDGSDPRWTAINKNDYTNLALHYYSHDNARTSNGILNITTIRKRNAYKAFNEKTKKFYADTKHIQSGMVQGWNKFCFTGGIVEFKAKLPGDPSKGGLWPALWMLGNLARATFVGSSDFMWPWSYNECNPKERVSQEINACSKVNHYDLESMTGRGAPEIDLVEAMQGNKEKLPSTNIQRPYQSMSLQVAPGVETDRPIMGSKPRQSHWYSGMEYASGNLTLNESLSEINPFFYGVTLVHKPKSYTYQSDAISANAQLRETHYNEHHVYRVEWEPPNEEDGTAGYIKWYSDGQFLYAIYGESLSLTGAEIPSEPMYLLMNTAVSSSWGFPAPCPEGCDCSCFECGKSDCACALPTGYCENFPASFEIDYVRVYQAVNDSRHNLGCSTENRPTDVFIKGHAERYMEPGMKRPLEPVRRGGELCNGDSDCGGSERGVCTSRGFCECNLGFTGPTCLAHDGFYDGMSSSSESVHVSTIYIPKGLVAIAALLIVGFLFSLVRALKNKNKTTRYQKLDRAGTHYHTSSSNATSYQNSSEYALPPKQKVVTYCVVDARLVDS